MLRISCSHTRLLDTGSINLTPRYEITSTTSGNVRWMPLATACFSFCIDCLVDSVPLGSFTSVDPKYCVKISDVSSARFTGHFFSLIDKNPLTFPFSNSQYRTLDNIDVCKSTVPDFFHSHHSNIYKYLYLFCFSLYFVEFSG